MSKPTSAELATLKKAYGIAEKYKMDSVKSALESSATGFFDFITKPARSLVREVGKIAKPVVKGIVKQGGKLVQDVQDLGKQAVSQGINAAAQNANAAVAAANPVGAALAAAPVLLRRGRGRPRKATHLKGMGMAIGE